jgi:putative aldouronate transport system permease protein
MAARGVGGLGETAFQLTLAAFMLAVCFLMLYPIWNIAVVSFNEGRDAMLGGIYWWPRAFTLQNYVTVFRNPTLFRGFGVSLARTVLATTLHVFFTSMVAYALTKRHLVGRTVYLAIGTVTLFFSAGLIPYFLLLRNLGLYDRFLVYVIPTMFNFYNLILFQGFFRDLPPDLEESARIDGANDFRIFLRIVMPLSAPVLAVIALFVGVYNWNDFFFGVIFIKRSVLLPIQTVLYRIISEATAANEMLSFVPGGIRTSSVTSQALKLATMVITTFPIVCSYPFLQKYFVKGLLLGAIKG